MIEGLCTILMQESDEIHLQLADPSHTLFQAHFPSQPILPGFALIDILAASLDDSIKEIRLAKFIAHLLPNDVLVCHIKTDKHKKNIKVFRKHEKVGEISYESV